MKDLRSLSGKSVYVHRPIYLLFFFRIISWMLL